MRLHTQRALAGIASLCVGGFAFGESFSAFNLVVRTDLDSTSEVEGRTAVGGNLSGTASNYGIALTPPAAFVNIDSLIVGGNLLASNININAGRLRLGGAQGGTNVNHNGGGSTILDAGAAGIVGGLGVQMDAASAFLLTMTPTNTVTIPNGQPAGVTFNAVPGVGGVAVFTLPDASLFTSNLVQSIDINLNGASSVIINVGGGGFTWNSGSNFVGNFNSQAARSSVLWNFHGATGIDLTGKAFNGAMLAPDANVAFQGVIEGSAWVNSMTQRGEVHLPNYTGFLPTPGAMGLAAVGGLVMARRRR